MASTRRPDKYLIIERPHHRRQGPTSPVSADSSQDRATRDGLAIGAAVGVVGIVFGVLAVAADFSVAQTCVTSLLVFTGASQFAAVSVIAAGGSAFAAAGSALLLAARNAFYGPVVAPWLRDDPIVLRAAAAHLIIDESTGIGAAQPATHRRRGFLSAGLSVYVMWNLGTLIGAVGGDLLGDLDAWGLDAAFPAAFVALLVPHLQRRTGRIAAVAGGLVAAGAVPLVPTGMPVIIASLGAAVGALATGRIAEPTDPQDLGGQGR